MKQTIWKFPFEVTDLVKLEMPEGALVLDVQLQNGVPCLWALVNPGNPLKQRRFRICGTGNPVDTFAIGMHIATFQMLEGALVWHVFEAE